MEIQRTIETKNASYNLTGLNDEQFSFIYRACNSECYKMMHRMADEDDNKTPIGILLNKLTAMSKSSVTIV